jgi:hypothetical protein
MGASSDRTQRLKSKAIAQFKDANPTVPDGGIRSFPPSTLLLQKQGNLNIPVYNHYAGVISVDAGCDQSGCPAPAVAAGPPACAAAPIYDNPAKRRY